MKNKKIIIPAVLLALTAASISPFISAQAATTDANASGASTVQKVRNYMGLKTKAGNNLNRDNNALNKTPKTAAEISALKAAQDLKFAAVNKALSDANYDAWVSAISALKPAANANVNAAANHEAKVTSITQKITRENFPKLVEAYNLEKQLEAKLTELGLNKEDGKGMMFGFGMGEGRGMGLGLGNRK
jgi:hypothetical protein